MIAKFATVQDVVNAAQQTGVRLREYRDVSSTRTPRVRFTLALNGEKYRRLNHRLQRKVGAVCWHGHRDFFRALFEANPRAVVDISGRFNNGQHIRYTAETFESTYQETGNRNIGSIMEPCRFSDACACDE